MHNNKIFYSRNFPSKLSKEDKKFVEIDLKNRLEKIEVLPSADLKSIFLGLLYQFDIEDTIEALPNYVARNGENKIKLFVLDEPLLNEKGVQVNNEQSAKIKVFHLGINRFMDNIITAKRYDSLLPISLVCIYNNPDAQRFFDDLCFETLKRNNFSSRNNSPKVSFIPIDPIHNLNRVILNKSLAEDVKKTLVLIEKRHIIYDVFGFNEVETKPKVILNFHGASGTGKTITAHAIANELSKKILALNYAEIESKYVGDAPKNLVNAFKCALENDALLFFDEADSFLGKRIKDVSSSSDQSVNSLRSQMLILLEQHEGIVIFATNLVDNYDKAFESRILKHLKFELPNKNQRGELIKLMLPSKLPYQNSEGFNQEEVNTLIELSDRFSGRLIKNAILDALTNAVMDDREYVIFSDFSLAFLRQKESHEELNSDHNYTAIKLSDNDISSIEEVVSEELSKIENE